MRILQGGSVSRARWAAIGAAVAVSLGLGSVAITHATVNTGEKAVFVPISPCRLFDMRPAPDQVGPRATPLAQGETYTQAVRGVNGSCNIPADATAVAMNVTAVGGTAGSFLTIWPSDVSPRPLASNLNWVPGSPPTPNKVDVKLSVADGKINLYNPTGTVSILADVVGYYADHNHDDRYYTKTQIDTTVNSDVVMSHGVLLMPNDSAPPTTITNFFDVSRVSGGNGLAQLSLSGPRSQSGIAFGLKSVTYCIKAPSGAAFITLVHVAGTAPVLDTNTDNTDRALAGCYVVPVNDAISTSFTLAFGLAGGSGFVDFTSINSTWTPVGLISGSVTDAGTTATEGASS
jgi:hypothetical protein